MSEIYTHRHALESFKHVALDKTGYSSDELPWSNKYIIRKLQEIRASVLLSQLAAAKDISEFSLQTLGCVEFEEMDRSDCPCAPASGCYWLKSKEPIPRAIKITSVTGTVAGETNPRFTFIKWDRFQYIPIARSKSTKFGSFWTIRDSGDGAYICLYGNRNLKVGSITGLWEDPMLTAAFPRCGVVDLDALCNPLDVDFYTDAHTRDIVLDMAWQKLLPIRSAAGADIQNDDMPGNTSKQG
jgi:hypothetical protein